MSLDIGNRHVNIVVTVMVIAMVVLMPLVDRRLAMRLGLNLHGGVGTNANADRVMRLRKLVLVTVFCIYLAAVAYLVFFSRNASEDYRVHVDLFHDLWNSVAIDLGIIDFIRLCWTQGVRNAMAHVSVQSPYNVAQVYLNVLLFVPMGYLLPYTFDWFLEKVHTRPVLASALASFAIENIQLVTKHGFYDVDDLVANTFGGLLGQFLFVNVAYVVTHPGWRKEIRRYLRWWRMAHRRTLYPYVRRVALSRVTLFATNEEDVWNFYVRNLGFRLLHQTLPDDSNDTTFLLGMGSSEVEIRCSNDPEELSAQYLTISAKRLPNIKRRLEKNGIQVGEYQEDPHTGRRCLMFTGPDGVCVTIMER